MHFDLVQDTKLNFKVALNGVPPLKIQVGYPKTNNDDKEASSICSFQPFFIKFFMSFKNKEPSDATNFESFTNPTIIHVKEQGINKKLD